MDVKDGNTLWIRVLPIFKKNWVGNTPPAHALRGQRGLSRDAAMETCGERIRVLPGSPFFSMETHNVAWTQGEKGITGPKMALFPLGEDGKPFKILIIFHEKIFTYGA
jgi:hypothetical protein